MLGNNTFYSHNHQLIIHKSFSSSNVHHVIGTVEISVKERNDMSRKLLTGPYSRMPVIALIQTFVQSKHTVSQFQPRSNLTQTRTWPLDKNIKERYIGFNSSN